MPANSPLPVPPAMAGQTLAAALRQLVPGTSWAQAKRLIETRRVTVNNTLCLNDARRLAEGDVVQISEEPQNAPPSRVDIRILHLDPNLIVIDKPAGIQTLRRDEESNFSDRRKEIQPTLDELVARMLPGRPPKARPGKKRAPAPPPVYPVHRLDRDTSGLMLFALSPTARNRLIQLFTKHEVRRSYRAVCLGIFEKPPTIETHLVRDRGDGLRGSVAVPTPDSKRAITHITPLETIGKAYTLLECRLETGRTHQIRIHLAEAGHMLCGEKLYTGPKAEAAIVLDPSHAPRQALHSATLDLLHPISGRPLHFDSPLPKDLSTWLERLRSAQFS
jgi:23S rRNA pseudouridine1911/1915/1917 synthase